MRARSSNGIRVDDLDLETAVLTPQNSFLTNVFADQLRSQFSDVLSARLAAGIPAVVVDLSKVTEMDSSGLALLFGLKRRTEGAGVRFSIRGLTPPVRRLVQLTNSAAALGL